MGRFDNELTKLIELRKEVEKGITEQTRPSTAATPASPARSTLQPMRRPY